MGAGGVVGEGEDFKADALDRVEGIVEGGDKLFEGIGSEAALFQRSGEVADFGSFEKGFEMAARKVKANLVLEEREKPVEVEVVGIKVREDDGGEVLEAETDAVEALLGDAGSESGIDEKVAPGRADDGGVASRSASEHAYFERHPCLQSAEKKFSVTGRWDASAAL
jgi:hypothetical protein